MILSQERYKLKTAIFVKLGQNPTIVFGVYACNVRVFVYFDKQSKKRKYRVAASRHCRHRRRRHHQRVTLLTLIIVIEKKREGIKKNIETVCAYEEQKSCRKQ